MTDKTDLEWARDVVGAATPGPWIVVRDKGYRDVMAGGRLIAAGWHENGADVGDAAAIALLGSVGRELLAVAAAYDAIVGFARDHVAELDAYRAQVDAADDARDALRKALRAARGVA